MSDRGLLSEAQSSAGPLAGEGAAGNVGPWKLLGGIRWGRGHRKWARLPGHQKTGQKGVKSVSWTLT